MIADPRGYPDPVQMSRGRMAGLVIALIAAAGVALVALDPTGGDDASGYSGGLMPPQVPIREFALRNENGSPISLASVKGGASLLTFLYTTCPDTCPLTAQQIRGAMDLAGHDVPVVAISVDPARDTPQAVRSWLRSEHLAGRMHWGLGTRAELERVWKDYAVLGQSSTSDHSAYVFLLDRDGRRCVSWPVSNLTPEGLAHDLKLIASRDGRC